jgi:hypothetical protein
MANTNQKNHLPPPPPPPPPPPMVFHLIVEQLAQEARLQLHRRNRSCE